MKVTFKISAAVIRNDLRGNHRYPRTETCPVASAVAKVIRPTEEGRVWAATRVAFRN